MKRPDWMSRLHDYLSSQARTEFRLGDCDCGAFAGGAVEAMTGQNPHAAVAGKYKTMAGAVKALRKLGHEDHVAYAASVLDEIDPAFATFGDIAVVDGDDGPALGVVTGPHIEVRMPGGRGLLPLTAAKRAFRA